MSFPINRRHQGLATTLITIAVAIAAGGWFPINRRHQGLATSSRNSIWSAPLRRFPINRRHQGLATPPCLPDGVKFWGKFPINRRHQGLATAPSNSQGPDPASSFQSIGVTKDWRLYAFATGKFDLFSVSNQ